MDPNKYPQTNQPETAQQPNPFEGMGSPEEVIPTYQHLMHQAAVDHQRKFAESHHPANVGGYLDETSEKVNDIVNAAAATIEPMLDQESSDRLARIRDRAGEWGFDAYAVARMMQDAPPAVRVVLDADVLRQATKMTAEGGANPLATSDTRGKVLNHASSPIVFGAMNAALDKEVHGYVRQQTSLGHGWGVIKGEINGASSNAVRAAIAQQRSYERSQQTQDARTEQPRPVTSSAPESAKVIGGDLFKGKAGEAVYDALFRNAAEASHDKPDSASSDASDTASPDQKRPAKPVDSAPKVKVDADTLATASRAVAADKHNRWLLDDLPLVKQVLNDLSEGESAGVTPDKTVRAYHLAAQRGDLTATEKVKVINALPKNPDGTLQR